MPFGGALAVVAIIGFGVLLAVCLSSALLHSWYRSAPRAALAFVVVAIVAWESVGLSNSGGNPVLLWSVFIAWWVLSAVVAAFLDRHISSGVNVSGPAET